MSKLSGIIDSMSKSILSMRSELSFSEVQDFLEETGVVDILRKTFSKKSRTSEIVDDFLEGKYLVLNPTIVKEVGHKQFTKEYKEFQEELVTMNVVIENDDYSIIEHEGVQILLFIDKDENPTMIINNSTIKKQSKKASDKLVKNYKKEFAPQLHKGEEISDSELREWFETTPQDDEDYLNFNEFEETLRQEKLGTKNHAKDYEAEWIGKIAEIFEDQIDANQVEAVISELIDHKDDKNKIKDILKDFNIELSDSDIDKLKGRLGLKIRKHSVDLDIEDDRKLSEIVSELNSLIELDPDKSEYNLYKSSAEHYIERYGDVSVDECIQAIEEDVDSTESDELGKFRMFLGNIKFLSKSFTKTQSSKLSLRDNPEDFKYLKLYEMPFNGGSFVLSFDLNGDTYKNNISKSDYDKVKDILSGDFDSISDSDEKYLKSQMKDLVKDERQFRNQSDTKTQANFKEDFKQEIYAKLIVDIYPEFTVELLELIGNFKVFKSYSSIGMTKYFLEFLKSLSEKEFKYLNLVFEEDRDADIELDGKTTKRILDFLDNDKYEIDSYNAEYFISLMDTVNPSNKKFSSASIKIQSNCQVNFNVDETVRWDGFIGVITSIKITKDKVWYSILSDSDGNTYEVNEELVTSVIETGLDPEVVIQTKVTDTILGQVTTTDTFLQCHEGESHSGGKIVKVLDGGEVEVEMEDGSKKTVKYSSEETKTQSSKSEFIYSKLIRLKNSPNPLLDLKNDKSLSELNDDQYLSLLNILDLIKSGTLTGRDMENLTNTTEFIDNVKNPYGAFVDQLKVDTRNFADTKLISLSEVSEMLSTTYGEMIKSTELKDDVIVVNATELFDESKISNYILNNYALSPTITKESDIKYVLNFDLIDSVITDFNIENSDTELSTFDDLD